MTKLTLKELSTLCNLSESTVRNIMYGLFRFNVKYKKHLCFLLTPVSIHDFCIILKKKKLYNQEIFNKLNEKLEKSAYFA